MQLTRIEVRSRVGAIDGGAFTVEEVDVQVSLYIVDHIGIECTVLQKSRYQVCVGSKFAW